MTRVVVMINGLKMRVAGSIPSRFYSFKNGILCPVIVGAIEQLDDQPPVALVAESR